MLVATLTRAVISIVLLLILPGYVTRTAWFARASAEEPQDVLSTGAEILLFSIIWTGGWGVVLAHMGWFSLSRLWLISLAFGATMGLVLRQPGRRLHRPTHLDQREGISVLALLLLAGALFFHPHEFIWGGADAGVYVNLGANIARTGAWRIEEPLIAQLPHELYPAMFREQPAPMVPKYVHLPGYYLTGAISGEVTPQFYPLHPVWIAVFYAVGGLLFGLYATPLWGLLGCLMVYFAGRAAVSRRAGTLAALFLTVTATQIWFSRYPTTEVLTQTLLFGGIYGFARHLEKNEQPCWWGFLSGLAFGQALISRVDLYALGILPAGYVLYCRYQGIPRRRFWTFATPFGLYFVYSLLFAWSHSRPYLQNTYSSILDLTNTSALLSYGALGLATLALAWFAAGRLHSPSARTRLSHIARTVGSVAAVAVALLAVYGYFVRPLAADSGVSSYYWYGDHDVPYVEAQNLVRLGWYLSPLGLLLSVGGTCLALRRGINRRSAALLATGLLFSVFFLYSSRNNPHHIYVMRRYVPVVIPFFLLMAAYALDLLRTTLPRYGRTLSTLLTIGLMAWLFINSRYVTYHVEYKGLIEQFDIFVDALGNRPAVLLFNDARAVGPAATVGTPLRYLEGFAVFDLQEYQLDMSRLAEQIGLWQRAGYRVLIVEGEQAVPLFSDSYVRPDSASFEFSYPMLETSYEHFPREVWTVTIPLSFWEIPALPSSEVVGFRELGVAADRHP